MKSKSAVSASRVARGAVAVLVVAAFAGCWWTFLRPAFIADGPVQLINVHGESMEPGLSTGDVALVYRRDSYSPGDVVAYRSGRTPDGDLVGSGSFIIHRITGGNGADGFVLRGDNTSSDDPWQPIHTDVAGEMVFSVPTIGTAVGWLSRPVHAGALLAAVFVTLVLGAEPRRRREPDQQAGDDRERDEEPVR